MSNDPQTDRRPTKRPAASKSLRFDSDNPDILTPQADNWTLLSLSTKTNKENLDKTKVLSYLNKQLTLLKRLRQQFGENFLTLEKSRTLSIPEQVSRAHIVSFDTLTRPVQPPTMNMNMNMNMNTISRAQSSQTIKNQAQMIKPMHKRTNSTDPSSADAPKSMNSLTIWNNVNRFFVVTPTTDVFLPKLLPSEPPDTKIQLGPHYSIAINQKLKQRYKNGNVQLRLPPEVIAESPEGTTSIIFHRLLSAFVTCGVSDMSSFLNEGGKPIVSNRNVQYPVNVAGTSIYSMYPFEQKLMLEVQSLNLSPDANGPKLTDNEVMNDIVQKNQELAQITAETNRLKQQLADLLKEKEKGLLERRENAKKWGTVSFKPEPGPKKDQKRPKKRDKLV